MVLRAVAVGFAGILAFGCVRSSTPVTVPTVVVIDGAVGGTVPSSSFEAPDARARGATWSARDEVEVEWHGSWWPAVVMEQRGARWLVHYEGYSDDWDEVVAGERIRERQLEPTSPESSDPDDDADP